MKCGDTNSFYISDGTSNVLSDFLLWRKFVAGGVGDICRLYIT